MSYLLDTDHLTLLQKRSPLTDTLHRRIQRVSPDDIAVTIISYQEQVLGWLSDLNSARSDVKIVECYQRLERVRTSFQKMNVLLFDIDSQAMFKSLRPKCRTMGTLDLRIASIALATDAILLTRNVVDFERVPGLQFENWVDS